MKSETRRLNKFKDGGSGEEAAREDSNEFGNLTSPGVIWHAATVRASRPRSGAPSARSSLLLDAPGIRSKGVRIAKERPRCREDSFLWCSPMGASRFRIDMVAEHPTKPGRYVLAIECDGATYHSSYTARDRDRLRQQQLENLGWRFHRIWSTDWFMRKEDEIQRALGAFKESVEFADKLDGGVVQNNHSNGVHRDSSPTTVRGGARPRIPIRTSITEYRGGELFQLLAWIASDGLLRTDDQIVEEMTATLGFSRRGSRIENVIRNAIALWRPRS